MSTDAPTALPSAAALADKLILEIATSAADGVSYHALATFPAFIGRGFNNDVIIQDDCVNAAHLRIERTDEGFTATDLGSVNGTELNNRPFKTPASFLMAGDVLRIGRTDIRVLTPDYPVQPAQKLQRASPFLASLSRSHVLWPALVLSTATVLIWSYQLTWQNTAWGDISAKTAMGLLATVLWAALWAVAGRLIRHKGRFRSHVSLFCIALILTCLCYFVERYADFLLTTTWLYLTLCYVINTSLLAWVLSSSLALATDMTQRRRRFSTAFFSIGIMAALFIFTAVNMQAFNQSPAYASQLEPYLSSLARAQSTQDFMQDNAALFSSDTFSDSPDYSDY